MGEHRDGGGAARRVHLVDAEQRAGGQNRRVRQAAELPLPRGREGDRLDPGLLGGDHVHDHGGGVDGASARRVQPDTLDRYPLLGHLAAGDDLGGVFGAPLGAVDQPGAPDRLLQRCPHGRVEPGQGVGEGGRGHPHLRQPHTVELLRVLDERRVAAMVHVLADRPHLFQGGLYVEVGTGQQVAQGAALGEGVAAQIDSGDHDPNSLRPVTASGRPYQWLIHNRPSGGDR